MLVLHVHLHVFVCVNPMYLSLEIIPAEKQTTNQPKFFKTQSKKDIHTFDIFISFNEINIILFQR